MGSEAVKVVVRCRPLNGREKALGCGVVVSMDVRHGQCFIQKPGATDEPPKQFTLDGTYFMEQTTEEMYNEIAYPLVEVCISRISLASFSRKAVRHWVRPRSSLWAVTLSLHAEVMGHL